MPANPPKRLLNYARINKGAGFPRPFAAPSTDAAETRVTGEQFIDGQAVVVAKAVEQRRPGPGIDLLAYLKMSILI